MQQPIFSILITTRNRLPDLKITLLKIEHLLKDERVECIVCVDGSQDDTYSFIEARYPKVKLLQNKKGIGLIASRNRLIKETSAKYAISLDDDAHFLSKNVLDKIEKYFSENKNCGVIACRIFWGKEPPSSTITNEKPIQVQSFAGCGLVWNLKAWREIPQYPEWFVFYGEEQFAAFHLFKNNWQVHYNPDLFIHHRVNIKGRKKDKDYRVRLRRSLRSGWYLYFLFYPLKQIPRRFLYTLWIQLKSKVFKGDLRALIAIIQALGDVVYNIPRIYKDADRFSEEEFKKFESLPETKIYWKPNDEN